MFLYSLKTPLKIQHTPRISGDTAILETMTTYLHDFYIYLLFQRQSQSFI